MNSQSDEDPRINPAHHPTRWYRYFLIKCYDCGEVAPAKVAMWGNTMFRCVKCGCVTYDEDFGEGGYQDVTAEEAEEWDYSATLKAEIQSNPMLLAQLEGVRDRAMKRGELPHVDGGQMRLWTED